MSRETPPPPSSPSPEMATYSFEQTHFLTGWQEEFSDEKAQTVSNRIETDNCWGPNVEQVGTLEY